jgi:UDP-glucose 4-epimerase
MAKILVTGGAGYIGSHTIVDLIENGFDVICIDNFSRSLASSFDGIKTITGKEIKNYCIDLCNYQDTKNVFDENKDIVGVIHFAAFKAVGESVEKPLMYYENNMYSLLNVLKCIQEYHVSSFVFSSSCSVYGNVDKLPVTEDTPLSNPECAYAATKQMGEQVIKDFSKVNDTKSILLRYFNPVGAHTSGLIGEVPFDRPNNLIPVITQTAIGQIEKMYVWGNNYDTRDGSCIRDYIHVMDIANAHTKALQYLIEAKNETNCETLNLGSGNGVSVLEAINSFEKVSGVNLNYEIGPRRAGDVVAIYANNALCKSKLGWKPKFSIDEMLATAWKWQLVLASKNK